MKNNLIYVGILVFLIFISCDGKFDPDPDSIILIKPDGLCEGGLPASNNRLDIPFEWSVDEDSNFNGFVVEIKNVDDSSSEPILIEASGSTSQELISLERGKNYEWRVIGNTATSSQVISPNKKFFSESQPTLDILPSPSKISIRPTQNAFVVTWTNDNETEDNLSYEVFLSEKIESGEAIEDVTKLNYDKRGNTRSESDEKEELISTSSLEKGDYVIRIRTNKTENGITNSANSYSKFSNN